MRYWPISLLILSFCSFANDMVSQATATNLFSYFALTTVCLFLLMRTRNLHLQSAKRSNQLQSKMDTIENLKNQNKTLLGDTSDELRAPLTMILGPLENLLNAEADHVKKTQISTIKNNGQQLLKIVDKMQTLSKQETEQEFGQASDEPCVFALHNEDKQHLCLKDRLFVERFESIIANNYQLNTFNRAQTASQMAISERQLNRKLGLLTDENFSCYLRKYRLRQAVCLMGKGLQVSQIGDKVGFSSATYFSSCFKTEYGKTVKQYEQQFRA